MLLAVTASQLVEEPDVSARTISFITMNGAAFIHFD
jgi:hypothetical protein